MTPYASHCLVCIEFPRAPDCSGEQFFQASIFCLFEGFAFSLVLRTFMAVEGGLYRRLHGTVRPKKIRIFCQNARFLSMSFCLVS
jgi:hypothetical protein